MQLTVLLWPPGARDGSVILGQELLMEPGGQDTEDFHRVVLVIVIRRLRCHVTIISHHAPACSSHGEGQEPGPQGDGTAEAEGSSPASTHWGRARVASTDCPWTLDE